MSNDQVRVLALDMGSSSVRAVVCDERAQPIPDQLARRSVTPHQDDDGRGELDPDVYVASLVACLDDLNEQGALEGVTDVAMCSQWHSVLAIDPEEGRPRGHTLTWLDTRAQVARDAADPEAFHHRTGTWVHPLYWTAKIPWLRAHRGRLGVPMRFLGLPDYVRRILLGTDETSVSMASGTGMLDLDGLDWDDEALSLAEVSRSELPSLSETARNLVGRWRTRYPTLADVPWHPVVGDGAASNLGAGCGTSDAVAVTVGTSMALRVVHTDPVPLPWEVWRYRVDPSRYVSGIAFSSGGVLHAWGVGLLKLDQHFEPKSVRPGESGLVVVPLHAGSRPPGRIPAGSGAVVGLSLDTSPEEFIAGTLDGVSLAAAEALEVLEKMIAPAAPLEVTLGGGAAHASKWWQESFAAAFERPVRIVDDPEVGALGAAAVALGCVPPRPTSTVDPDPNAVEKLRDSRVKYDRLRQALDSDPDDLAG